MSSNKTSKPTFITLASKQATGFRDIFAFDIGKNCLDGAAPPSSAGVLDDHGYKRYTAIGLSREHLQLPNSRSIKAHPYPINARSSDHYAMLLSKPPALPTVSLTSWQDWHPTLKPFQVINPTQVSPSLAPSANLVDQLEPYGALLAQDRSRDEAEEVQELGKQIRQIRRACGYTRAELARQIQCSEALVVLIENGEGSSWMAHEMLEQVQQIHRASVQASLQ